MIVPCMVNNSLYCWSDTMLLSGPNSCTRMIIAIMPAMRKNPKDVIRYRWPMTLWSVEESQSAMIEPLRALRGEVTAAWAGFSSVVTGHLLPSAAMPVAGGSTG
jgi:hypothetical protein